MTLLAEEIPARSAAMGRLDLPTPDQVLAAARSDELRELNAWVEADLDLPVLRRACRDRGDRRRLRLVYLVPVTWPGGGARVLFDHVNQLSAGGDEVTVVSHFPPPDWTALGGRFVQVPFGQPLASAIPDCDLIVAGIWSQILLARQAAIAPVIHFEQGSPQLFGTLDPHTLVTMSAAVRGADASLAAGEACATTLSERFGVACELVASGVDCHRFRPPGSPGARRHVLFSGLAADPDDGIDLARLIAAGLATSHPQVEMVWITPELPAEVPFGRAVVSPSLDELAALYREALVAVGTSRLGPLGPASLEAMASGTPVVAAADDGWPSHLRHEDNALLAPIGDAAALLALVRRVLDEPALAARLAESGLSTARATSLPVVIGEVRAVFAGVLERAAAEGDEASEADDVSGADAHGADDADDGVVLGDIVLTDELDLARLRARIRSCPTSELAIPVSRPVRGAFRRVTWEVVATLPGERPGVTRVYLPGRSDERGELPESLAGLSALGAGAHQEALACLLPRLQQAERGAQPPLLRWVVVALLGLGRYQDALELAVAGARAYPCQPDFLALSFIAASSAQFPVEHESTLRSVALLGNGSRFEEWLDSPLELMRTHLVGGLGL